MKRFRASPQMYILVFIRLNDVTYYFFVSLQIACFRRDYVVRQKLSLVFSIKPNMFRVNPRHSLMLSRPMNLQPPSVSSNMKRIGAFSMSFGVSLKGQ